MNIEYILTSLKKSKFRASFHLKKVDIEYIKEKGWETIQTHCHYFISKRLAPAVINNDGKQTPTHGHPVFIAQHACACCCRGCLNKWHKIKKGIIIPENDSDRGSGCATFEDAAQDFRFIRFQAGSRAICAAFTAQDILHKIILA